MGSSNFTSPLEFSEQRKTKEAFNRENHRFFNYSRELNEKIRARVRISGDKRAISGPSHPDICYMGTALVLRGDKGALTDLKKGILSHYLQ